MGKRYTDTEKWNKRFIRGLQAPYKLLWLFITDECSAAGIWDVDLDAAQLKLGVKLKLPDALKNFQNKIVEIDNGEKWFIPSFIEFQYNELSEINRAHTKIIQTLKKFCLIDDDLKVFKGLIKAHPRPLQGYKVEVKDKVMEEETVMDIKGEIEKICYPFETEKFFEYWEQWKKYKNAEFKFSYKSIQSEQAALNELTKVSGGVEQMAINIILQSMAQGWKGFFNLKENGKANNNSKYATVAAELEARFSGNRS